jgi:hypothetical protein
MPNFVFQKYVAKIRKIPLTMHDCEDHHDPHYCCVGIFHCFYNMHSLWAALSRYAKYAAVLFFAKAWCCKLHMLMPPAADNKKTNARATIQPTLLDSPRAFAVWWWWVCVCQQYTKSIIILSRHGNKSGNNAPVPISTQHSPEHTCLCLCFW